MQRRVLLPALLLWLTGPGVFAAEMRVGMIGLDTSHVIAFTRLMNDPGHRDHVPGMRVVSAFKGGSPDVESSRTRVDGFTRQLEEEFGVKILPTIEALCREVDVVMLMSVDGRPHLEQARPVIRAGKRLFIDKPVAGSLRDAIAIYDLAEQHGVPVFSSSAYRFYDSLTALKARDVGEVRGAISYGPCSYEPHHPDLFWYGVHPTEALFAVMGTGCESVVRMHTLDTDVVTGVWEDGRVGTLRGIRNAASPHQVIVFGTEAVAAQEGGGGYAPLVREIAKFFQTGEAPVSPEETIEMFAFMEAADESKRRGGEPVKLSEVIEQARRESKP
jgi:predicted dehydrogenase